MKTVGIIAEFNPFHNGHQYIIHKAKQVTKADNVIIICSGNYVQRGTPAIINKYERAKMAVLNGADAVFELPIVYATASAELFARAAVSFLEQLHCVDFLCFGCEADNFNDFPTIVNILNDEPATFKNALNIYLENGLSFPKARSKALVDYCREQDVLDEYTIESILLNPNNILAIEYMKAIKHLHSSIKPVAIKRLGEDYHSFEINKGFASATAIRREIKNDNYDVLAKHIPSNCYNLLKSVDKVYLHDFDLILGEKLWETNDFSHIYGINEDLSNRIEKQKTNYTNIETFVNHLQSKNYTYSAISRVLLHLCLDIQKNDVNEFIKNGYHFYARLLAFNKNSAVLSVIKEKSSLPIISKLSTFYSNATSFAKHMLDINIHCDALYRMIVMNKYKKELSTEFESQIFNK